MKALGGRYSALQVAFLRSVLPLPVLLEIMRRKRQPVKSRAWPTLLARGLTGALSMITYFWAIAHIPLASAVLLNYSSPIFTAVIAYAVMGERLSAASWAWIGLAFSGVALVLKPTFSGAPGPYLVALLSGVLAGFAYATVKKLTREETPWRIIVYYNMTTALIALPPLLSRWVWPDRRDWALLAGVSATAMTGQALMTTGFELSPISSGSAALLLTVMLTAVGGWWFFGEVPTPATLAGMAAIAAGVSGLTLRSS